MHKSSNIYYNLGYWFLLIIPLVAFAFYPTYFAIISEPQPAIFHIHFSLMILWVAILITQPFLIKYKRVDLHRKLGKFSYLLVPMVLLSVFAMMRYSYYHFIDDKQREIGQGIIHWNKDELLIQAGAYEVIPFIYFTWFLMFYLLAIKNRRHTPTHSRYMLATSLTLLGPTVDRIVVNLPTVNGLSEKIPFELLAFCIADSILIALLVRDYKSKKSIKTISICLAIYVIGQVLNFTLPKASWWGDFVSLIMRPIP